IREVGIRFHSLPDGEPELQRVSPARHFRRQFALEKNGSGEASLDLERLGRGTPAHDCCSERAAPMVLSMAWRCSEAATAIISIHQPGSTSDQGVSLSNAAISRSK